MKMIIGILLLGMILAFGCIQQPPVPPGNNQTCDATKPCETGECYKFEDIASPICYTGDPCARCASGTCMILESYPPQIRCTEEEPPAGFCGWSTNGRCSSDADCMSSGCSGQVCQSKFEEPVVTTCEYRDCYNAGTYGLSCGCVNQQCQWHSQTGQPAEEPVSSPAIPETETGPEQNKIGLQYCDDGRCPSEYSCKLLQTEERPTCLRNDDIYSACDICPSGKCYMYSYNPMAIKCLAEGQ